MDLRFSQRTLCFWSHLPYPILIPSGTLVAMRHCVKIPLRYQEKLDLGCVNHDLISIE